MPTLYILCGPSGCGKSTWRDFYIQEHENVKYVSRDTIRFSMLQEGEDYFAHEKEVFQEFVNTLAQTLVDGFDVIADATHLNAYSRNKLTAAIDKIITDYEIKYVVFYTPMADCIERDDSREGIMHVGKEVIQGMFRSFKAPTLEEDSRANEIIEVGDGKEDFSFLMAPYWKE